ncbi:MAG: hypothetical protein JWN70_4940 [Planctomycetaceae bacterium]|nr:hypothetical protein [Planctomycetaceae bacterium]
MCTQDQRIQRMHEFVTRRMAAPAVVFCSACPQTADGLDGNLADICDTQLGGRAELERFIARVNERTKNAKARRIDAWGVKSIRFAGAVPNRRMGKKIRIMAEASDVYARSKNSKNARVCYA